MHDPSFSEVGREVPVMLATSEEPAACANLDEVLSPELDPLMAEFPVDAGRLYRLEADRGVPKESWE